MFRSLRKQQQQTMGIGYEGHFQCSSTTISTGPTRGPRNHTSKQRPHQLTHMMAGTEKLCHPKREKLNIHTILFIVHMLYTNTPRLNFAVSTKQKRTRREISTTTSCRPDNIRRTLTRGRVSSFSIVVVAGYLAVLLSIVTLALYDSNTNQLPSIPLLLFSSNVGPILVHARMTNPRYKEDDQNNSNESDSSKSDENEGNSYDRPPSPKQRNNRKPRTRRNRQQRDHTRFFNNPDEFQNRNSHQQNQQQQQRNNQRPLNPFEIVRKNTMDFLYLLL